MTSLEAIQKQLAKAHARLQEVMDVKDKSLIERDASIQRFEFTFELYWKTFKKVLIAE